jgi:hypothetical protein
MAYVYNLSGTWRSSYTFTTPSPDADFTNDYDVQIHQIGNQVVIQSTPTKDGSYILLRLTRDGRLLTGTWYEHTAEKSHYKGVVYYGPLQLVIDEDGHAMRGNWLGVDDQMKMQGGEQTIVRVKK